MSREALLEGGAVPLAGWTAYIQNGLSKKPPSWLDRGKRL
jgi:hypothetical protein